MKTAWRYFEFGLMACGLGLLGVYVFFRIHAWFFQAYDSWSFDQALNRTQTSERVSPGRAENAEAPDAMDHRDWASTRVLAFERSLSRSPQKVVGRLLIPVLNLNVTVLEGTDPWTLNRAVGHIEGTALPGKTGNVGISAHRDGFFRNLGHITPGDKIAFVTTDGTYTYQVDNTKVVNPEDVHVLAPTAKPVLTLVTCYPFYFVGAAPQRFIVQAQLIR